MKQIYLLNLLSSISRRPGGRKKLKIIILVGLVSFLALSGLAIWGSITAINYATATIHNKNFAGQIETAKARLQDLPVASTADCWDKAQSLMNVGAWMGKPVSHNLNILKVACLETAEKETI